jgi:hypothetical protein
MFYAPQSNMEKPGQSVSSENTSQKMFIGSDKVSEIVNYSDSDGGKFSELTDSNTCKINSCFSSSEEEEVDQPQPDRDRRKTRKALPKCADIDFELG